MNDHLSIQEVLNAIDAIPYKGTFQISAFAKKSNAHYTRRITPKRVTSLRSLSPRPCVFWERNFEETKYCINGDWRAVGDAVTEDLRFTKSQSHRNE